MRIPAKTEGLAKAIKSLLQEKQTVQDREKGLVRALNAVLTKIGYQVVQGTSRRGPGRPPVKRGRPAGKTVRRGKRGRPRVKRGRPAAKAVKPQKQGRPRKAE